jgi:drug/metabolite transporter (DMT)-like permease
MTIVSLLCEEVGMKARTLGLWAISLAIVIWGFNFVATKVTLRQTDAFALVFLRHAATTAIFFMIWVAKGNNPFADLQKHWRRVLPIALLGIVGNQLFFMWGISLTTPSHSALMYTLLPISTAFFARLFIKERVSFLRWFGISIAFCGAVLLATERGFDFEQNLLQGDLITLVAVLCFSLFMVFGKPVLMELGALRVLVVGYMVSAPIMLGITLPSFVHQDWSSLSLIAWAGAAFLIIFATVVAYILHQFALKHLSAALLSAFAYGQPVTAAVFSVSLLGEELGKQFFLAACLICVGLFITERFKAKVDAK